MDNAQKAIMIGVGLFITIIIIAAVMVVVGVSNDLLDNKNQEMVNASNAINYNSYAQYDEATLDGAKVIAMVKSLKNREKVLQKSKFCCILWVSHIFFTTQAYGGEQT